MENDCLDCFDCFPSYLLLLNQKKKNMNNQDLVLNHHFQVYHKALQQNTLALFMEIVYR